MKYLFIVLILFSVGCKSSVIEQERKIEVSHANERNNIEKTQPERKHVEVDDSIDSYDPSFEEVKEQFEQYYEKTEVLVDSIKIKGQLYKLKLNHYCLFDTLIVPAEYNWSENPQDYLVHNFASEILLTRDGDIVLDTIMKKDFFRDILNEGLLEYTVLIPSLYYMGFDKGEKTFKINYSISIPATDIGTGVILYVGVDGSIWSGID